MVNKIIEGKKISTNRVPTKVSAEYKDLGGKLNFLMFLKFEKQISISKTKQRLSVSKSSQNFLQK